MEEKGLESSDTTKFSFAGDKTANVKELMSYVYGALKEKG